jgi:SdrD B-like domain/GEVED domain
MKIGHSVFFALFFIFSNYVYSQNLTVNISVPISGENRFSICGGEKLVTVRVENSTGAGGNPATLLTNIVGTLNLASAVGIKFTGTVITLSKTAGLADVTINNASTPTFNIPDLAYTEFVEFKVGLAADCGSLGLVKDGIKPKIQVSFSYTGGSGVFAQDSPSFEIVKPALSIPKVVGNFDPTANTFDAGYGVKDSITVQVTNAGNGTLSEFIYWVKDHPQLTLQAVKVGNLVVPAMGSNGDTTFYKITSSLINQAFSGTGSPLNNVSIFQFNESLNIKEVWLVDDCKIPAADIYRGARYGCDNFAFPKCEEAIKNTGVRYGLLRPLIENNWYYGFGDPFPACGVSIAGQYLTNIGRVKASEINFDVKYWVPEYPGTGSIDLANIYVQKKEKSTGILGPLVKVTPTSLLEKVSNGCVPSADTYRGAAITLSSDFDLLPGDTLFVKWQQNPECQQSCNPNACEITANNYPLFGHSGISTSNYTDPCKLQEYLITYRYNGSLYARMPYFAEAPALIAGGQTGTFNMTLTDFNVWKYTNHGSTRTDAQGNKNISNYPKRRIQFIYINETGLDWNKGANDFTWTDNQGDTWAPTSIKYTDNQLAGNDTLIVTYTGAWPANFNPAASNKIKVNYLGDCSEVPACVKSKVANVSSIIRFMADSTCTDCANTLGDVIGCKQNSAITVKCPSCEPCAGLTPISLKIERINFEKPDNNNDFKPDAAGAINKNLAALNRAISGDTVMAKYVGVFHTSANHTVWENAYNVLQLPSSLGLTFTPIGGKLSIVDTDGSGTLIGQYEANILQQYPSGNEVITNISPSNVMSLSTTNIPSSYLGYGDGDTVNVEIKLVVADNSFNFTNDGNVFKSVDVGDASFAAHVAIDQTNKPNKGTNTPNTEPKDRYQCDVVTSRFYYIEMYHNLESGDNSYPGGCVEGNMGYDWEGMFIGTRTVDFFPFEYRSPKGYVTVSKFVKRSDLIFTKVEWQLYAKDFIGRPPLVGDVPLNSGNYGQTLGTTTPAVHYGVLPMDSPYIQVVGDTVYTFLNQFVKDNFGDLIADEGYRIITRPYFVASCATEKSGQNAIRHYPLYNFKLDDKVFGYSELKNVNRYAYRPYETNYGKLLHTLGYGYAGGPTLTLQTGAIQQDLVGSEACFNVDIVNSSDYLANNTWMTLSNSSGAIQIKSVKEVNPTTGAVLNTPLEQLGVYQLGNTTAATNGVPKVRRFQICVFADNCDRDSIKVNMGWDCLAYPKTVEEAACNKPVFLYTMPVPAELGMIINEPVTDIVAPLCEEQSYVVQLSSSIVGTLNNINLQYELPGGMVMVPGSFQYLYPSPASGNPSDALPSAWITAPNQPTNIYGTTYLVNATNQGHPILSTTGLVGTTDIGKNFMFVKFKVNTTCSFMAGSAINFLSWAHDACDRVTNYRYSPSKKLNIEGTPEVYRTEINVDPTAMNPCLAEKKTINAGFAILNGSVPTSGDDSVRVILPIGLNYSQTLSMDNTQLSGPSIKSENGQQVIYWKVNSGLIGGTVVNWAFEISSTDAGQVCNQPYEIIVQTFRSSSASCQGTVCSIRILSDEARSTVTFVKPKLSISSFAAASKAMPPTQEEVSYQIKIKNDGEAIPAGTVTKIEVYADNGNGDVGSGDVLLFTATTTDAIPSGGIAVLSGKALVNAGSTCALIAMVNPLTTCTCEKMESFVVKPLLDIPFGPRTLSICSNQKTSNLGPEPLSNHTYGWIPINGANITALSSTTSTPITFKLRNTGTQNQTHTYVLRTLRNNDCYVFDTLSVTVYPEIADSTTFTVCSNADFKLAGPTNGSQYQWVPATNLSNIADPQASVIGGVSTATKYTLNYIDANGCPAVYIAKINVTDCGSTALGDTVWYDKNVNGLQDIGEPGIEGMVVYLYSGSNTTIPISSTTTNSSGYYIFNNLPQGFYRVGFVLPDGGVFTTANVSSNSNDQKDSDADPITGLAPQVFVSNGVAYTDFDAGIVFYEYGDAPNSYKTTNAASGAKHLLVDGLKLGTLIDGDADAHSPALPGANAQGDDVSDGLDDEDGVAFFEPINTLNQTYSISIKATNSTAVAAKMVGWIDFNRNGTFEASEGASVDVPQGTNNGSFILNYTVPSTIVSGLTYLRIRLSTDIALTTSKMNGLLSSGEVEDYELNIIRLVDWGDNPDSYQTDAAGATGASHYITKYLFLGNIVDGELDGFPASFGAESAGDNNNQSNDEDGAILNVLRNSMTSYNVQLKATNIGTTPAKLIGWMDFNKNGTYQEAEGVQVIVPAGTTNGTFTLAYAIPTGSLSENDRIYARFRLSTDPSLSIATPGGIALDGEVEDYSILVTPCVKPNAGVDISICLPKNTVKLATAGIGNEWVKTSSSPLDANIDINTGAISDLTTVGTYYFKLQNIGDATCADTVQITVEKAKDAIVLCNDMTKNATYTLTAPASLTSVVWYNMANEIVGNGYSLLVSPSTKGLEDGTEAFYYSSGGSIETNCNIQLCCPQLFVLQSCCQSSNCLGVTVIKK